MKGGVFAAAAAIAGGFGLLLWAGLLLIFGSAPALLMPLSLGLLGAAIVGTAIRGSGSA